MSAGGEVAGMVAIAAVAAWLIWGDGQKQAANLFWKEGPAPWETVDGFYYPDRDNLGQFETAKGFANLQGCRDWVSSRAAQFNDPALARGDYECGVGKPTPMGPLNLYRLTVR